MLGSGFLSLQRFVQFVDGHPQVRSIELSNWGELFLNPQIVEILRCAHERDLVLTAGNGVNLNSVKPEVLEALVKYRLRLLNCSIDGASRETYATYRRNGNWEKVIRNLREINRWKRHYQSEYPLMNWQYIAFSHNEHEISQARRLAGELDMTFSLKLSWDDLYGSAFSPVSDKELIRRESGLGVADRDEFREKFGYEYAGREVCLEMWHSPQVNIDGRLLGCAINYRGDYGNVFERGLYPLLNSEPARYARQMLMGKAAPREGIPCTNCRIYANMQRSGQWITAEDIVASEQGKQAAASAAEQGNVIPSRGYTLTVGREVDDSRPWKPEILFRGSTAALDFLQCHRSALVPGHIPHPPHAHAEEELLIMLSGEAELILAGDASGEQDSRVHVHAGDFVYYPAQYAHTLQATGWEPANYLMFKWEGSGGGVENELGYRYFSACDLLQRMEGRRGFNAWVLFESQTRYLGKLHCHLSILRAGAGYAEHADDYDVAIIVLEGEVQTLGNVYGPYSVIYYARGEPHGMHNPGSFDARYIVFEFHAKP